jgi:hypothetical protein
VSDPYDWRAPDGDQSTWSDADWLRYEARSNFITEDIERADRIADRLDGADRPGPPLRCATHPGAESHGWGCPDCVAELRRENGQLRAEVDRWRRETKAPPLPIIGCDCHACVVLRRHQRELRH